MLFVVGDSHEEEIVARVREALAGRPADLLFVDVPEFWESVKTADARELVENRGQGGFGIGVLPV